MLLAGDTRCAWLVRLFGAPPRIRTENLRIKSPCADCSDETPAVL